MLACWVFAMCSLVGLEGPLLSDNSWRIVLATNLSTWAHLIM
uniref:Uncharacterized protein n=1 Tax=Rhizophora mucronata TaxID=61149 RepID=A0A2P2N9V7_RHIMU